MLLVFFQQLITEVLVLWPGCKLVHGKPRHSQSEGSVERANKDVEAILACWQKDYNTTKWSQGLRFVQWQKNTRFHRGIGRTPYEAMFGQKSHLGVTATNLPEDVVDDGLETEEQLAEALAADNIQDSTTSMCKDCGGPCSMDDDICHLCERKLGIQAEREGARRKQHSQAEKMQLVSTMRFKKAEVGDSVMVPITLVDRGRAEFPNAKAVVLQVDDSGTCKLGTRHGILKQLYSRNQFTPCEQQFLSIDDVPQEKEISLREVANADSVGHGQGFIKCTCSMSCNNNRCKCFKNQNVCNSRCKCGSSCKNK